MSNSSSDAPPRYTEVIGSHSVSPSYSGDFVPTKQLDIQAIGYDEEQALIGWKLENIPVISPETGETKYISIRLKKSSYSCTLVRVAPDDSYTSLISTVYRFGPWRHPKMKILPPNSTASVEQAIKDESLPGELIEVKSGSWTSHTQIFDTSFGKFQWRYGSKSERVVYNADSLLIMELIENVSLPCGKKGKNCIRIAQLIRNDQFRTPGSKKRSGGNGGRMMIDLRNWSDQKYINLEKLEQFIVASCLLALKKEADRFINHYAGVAL